RSSLCGHPCSPDVPLQALDCGRLAGSRRGAYARGLAVVATGGPDDRQYLDEVWAGQPEVHRIDGKLSWPELAGLIAGARAYVGPDTSVTHMAAATCAPTIALYGPTDPLLA